jgi:hypothetical protein
MSLPADGFELLPGAIAPGLVARLLAELGAALGGSEEHIRSRAGQVYAARNVLDLCPATRTLWRESPLPERIGDILGPQAGLVRGLFFDKPPERSWALPWHQDLTICVRPGPPGSSRFSKPTHKGGRPHVEAPCEVLERMLTARLHLDDVTPENGPLRVSAGSHRHGKQLRLEGREATILAQAGDVLLMRPLLAHASGNSLPGTTRRRRILHLEFAADPALPDGFAWHEFLPIRS